MVRRSAAEALADTGSPELTPHLIDALENVRRIIDSQRHAAVPRVMSQDDFFLAMDSPGPGPSEIEREWERERSQAEQALPLLRSEEAVLLARLGADAVPDLLAALEEENAVLRATVVDILGEIGDQRAVPGLIELLQGQEPTLRPKAEAALKRIGGPEATGALATHRAEEAERCALDLVRAARNDQSEPLAEAAGKLRKLGSDAVPHVLSTLEEDHATLRGTVVDILGEIRDQKAVPALAELLEVGDRALRMKAFFNFAIPLGVLLIFGATVGNDTVPGRNDVDVITLFVPGILAFAVVVVAYGNLAATVALQRADGVLKRIRATPLNPSVFIGGQILSVLGTTLLISVATIGAGALAFGVVPRAAAVPQLLVVLALGIACFAALGVAISAVIPTADAAGPITNGTYLPLAMVSGMFSVTVELPAALDAVIGAFPLKALADALRSAYDPATNGLPVGDTVVLVAWAIAGAVLARRFFRWTP